MIATLSESEHPPLSGLTTKAKHPATRAKLPVINMPTLLGDECRGSLGTVDRESLASSHKLASEPQSG